MTQRKFLILALFLNIALLALAATAQAQMLLRSSGGDTASAPVAPNELQRIELQPSPGGVTQVVIYTTRGQRHRLILAGGPLVSVEFAGSQIPPMEVYTPPSGGSGGSGDNPYGCGEQSYAGGLVVQKPGLPAPAGRFSHPSAALGPPDGRVVSLGCGGELVLRFDGVHLMDVPGPDIRLHTAQVTPMDPPEEVLVSIRLDGTGRWLDCGMLEEGGELDISSCAPAGMRYNQIRLQDSGRFCQMPAPGADIDAVELLGCVGN